MKLDRVNVYKIRLPFAGHFSHARKKGDFAHNIIVEAIPEQEKIRGYGEGAPRTYATGESQESAFSDVTRLLGLETFPWDFGDVEQIGRFVDDLPERKSHNAALCAIEMALLDLLGKSKKRPLIEFFNQSFRGKSITYGAAIPLEGGERVLQIIRLIKKLELRDLRVKMGTDFEQNERTLEVVRTELGPDCEVRIDPNGIWDRDLAFRHITLIEKYRVNVVEEPITGNISDLKKFSEKLSSMNVLLMACQSAATLKDIEEIVRDGCYKMVNVKLSRSGGFRRAFRMIHYLRSRGMVFQIGCNLGESGILSAGGRVLGLLCRDAKYYDGSYDKYILKENITNEDVSFGPGGRASPLKGAGLGVEVSHEKLERLGKFAEKVTVYRP